MIVSEAFNQITRRSGMSKDMPVDGKRMIFGGFAPLFDERS